MSDPIPAIPAILHASDLDRSWVVIGVSRFMEILSADSAYANLTRGIRAKTFRFPSKKETDFYRHEAIFPKLAPRFRMTPGSKVFTIGSCFARNIEGILLSHGLDVPVAGFTLPEGELPWPAPHILNEYNAGTILQRLESVFGAFEYSPAMGVEDTPEGVLDLFLHINTKPVTKERLTQRREEIATLHTQLLSSETVIITLGLIECWFDNAFGCYLNKAPSKRFIAEHPGRFAFHRLGAEDVIARMTKAIELLNASGTFNILITVSPIPVEATFSGDNAVIANSYSKSVLRVAVETLRQRFTNVDYLPSYEIVMSGGVQVFQDDNVHVTASIVQHITRYMVANYLDGFDETGSAEMGVHEIYEAFMQALYNDGDPRKAETLLAKLGKTFPNHWCRYDAMSHVHSDAGRLDAAIDHVRRALSVAPDHHGLVARIAGLEEERGNFDEADRLFRAAAASGDGYMQRLQSEFLERHRDKAA